MSDGETIKEPSGLTEAQGIPGAEGHPEDYGNDFPENEETVEPIKPSEYEQAVQWLSKTEHIRKLSIVYAKVGCYRLTLNDLDFIQEATRQFNSFESSEAGPTDTKLRLKIRRRYQAHMPVLAEYAQDVAQWQWRWSSPEDHERDYDQALPPLAEIRLKRLFDLAARLIPQGVSSNKWTAVLEKMTTNPKRYDFVTTTDIRAARRRLRNLIEDGFGLHDEDRTVMFVQYFESRHAQKKWLTATALPSTQSSVAELAAATVIAAELAKVEVVESGAEAAEVEQQQFETRDLTEKICDPKIFFTSENREMLAFNPEDSDTFGLKELQTGLSAVEKDGDNWKFFYNDQNGKWFVVISDEQKETLEAAIRIWYQEQYLGPEKKQVITAAVVGQGEVVEPQPEVIPMEDDDSHIPAAIAAVVAAGMLDEADQKSLPEPGIEQKAEQEPKTEPKPDEQPELLPIAALPAEDGSHSLAATAAVMTGAAVAPANDDEAKTPSVAPEADARVGEAFATAAVVTAAVEKEGRLNRIWNKVSRLFRGEKPGEGFKLKEGTVPPDDFILSEIETADLSPAKREWLLLLAAGSAGALTSLALSFAGVDQRTQNWLALFVGSGTYSFRFALAVKSGQVALTETGIKQRIGEVATDFFNYTLKNTGSKRVHAALAGYLLTNNLSSFAENAVHQLRDTMTIDRPAVVAGVFQDSTPTETPTTEPTASVPPTATEIPTVTATPTSTVTETSIATATPEIVIHPSVESDGRKADDLSIYPADTQAITMNPTIPSAGKLADDVYSLDRPTSSINLEDVSLGSSTDHADISRPPGVQQPLVRPAEIQPTTIAPTKTETAEAPFIAAETELTISQTEATNEPIFVEPIPNVDIEPSIFQSNNPWEHFETIIREHFPVVPNEPSFDGVATDGHEHVVVNTDLPQQTDPSLLEAGVTPVGQPVDAVKDVFNALNFWVNPEDFQPNTIGKGSEVIVLNDQYNTLPEVRALTIQHPDVPVMFSDEQVTRLTEFVLDALHEKGSKTPLQEFVIGEMNAHPFYGGDADAIRGLDFAKHYQLELEQLLRIATGNNPGMSLFPDSTSPLILNGQIRASIEN